MSDQLLVLGSWPKRAAAAHVFGDLEGLMAASSDNKMNQPQPELDRVAAKYTDSECKRTYYTAALDHLPSGELDNSLGDTHRQVEKLTHIVRLVGTTSNHMALNEKGKGIA